VIRSRRFCINVILISAALLGRAAIVHGQVSGRVSKIDIGTFTPGNPLTIQVEFSNTADLDRVEIAFRQFGQHDYKRAEMALEGHTATASIPATELVPPFIEYYIILYLRNAPTAETYPLENAQEHPLRVDLQGTESGENAQITILSPEPNERLRREDVLISFVVSPADSTLDPKATRVYLDGLDVSGKTIVTDLLYVLRPENLSIPLGAGNHVARVELVDRQGKTVTDRVWNFGVLEAGNYVEAPSPWQYHYGAVLETRNENIAGDVTPYNRATLNANGTYQEFRFDGKLYATNEESDRRQPQNRFYLGAQSPWARIGYGDSYPSTFPELIMSGKRVRGLNGSLMLGAFNLDVAHGDILRRIESDTVKTFPGDSLTAEQGRDSTGHYVLYDPGTDRWAQLRSGTFNREITIVHPSFGRENAHIGFTYLKSADDVNSIRYGTRPEENLVIGSDLTLAFDRHNVEINGQAAISATNRDISHGTFTDADIDSTFKPPTYSDDDRTNFRQIRDLVSRFITVNSNLVPLSLKKLQTLAYEGGLNLNYFDNSIRFSYIRHGESFESFGQPFLRTDVVGYNISDRVRLMENRVFLSGGFERLQDNTANTKAATTTGTTANIGVSCFPRTDFPNVTVAYLFASNVNDRNLSDTLYAVDDQTNRVLIQLGKEFTFGARHSANLGIGTSVRNDNTVKHLDTRNTTVSLSTSSTFEIPLQTSLSITVNSSKFVTGLGSSGGEMTLGYTTLYGSAQYRLAGDRLQLTGSLSPTFGDIERVLVNAGAQYRIMPNLSAQGQMFLFFNTKLFGSSNPTNDAVWSLILRLEV